MSSAPVPCEIIWIILSFNSTLGVHHISKLAFSPKSVYSFSLVLRVPINHSINRWAVSKCFYRGSLITFTQPALNCFILCEAEHTCPHSLKQVFDSATKLQQGFFFLFLLLFQRKGAKLSDIGNHLPKAYLSAFCQAYFRVPVSGYSGYHWNIVGCTGKELWLLISLSHEGFLQKA